MFDEVLSLLGEAGIQVRKSERDYRPSINLDDFNTKILKPRNVITMLAEGARDIGFAGNDWVREMRAELVELLDTGLNPVRLVVAAPADMVSESRFPFAGMRIATEYVQLANDWLAQQQLQAKVLQTYGATEVFPPEDADCIIDNTASGSTLRANNLQIVDEVMQSSTKLYANPRSLENPGIRNRVDTLVTLLRSVLEARSRVMVELNVSAECLDQVVEVLPCMRRPTISTLHGDAGFAIRAAVPKNELLKVVPLLKERGATDIVTSSFAQIVP